MAVDVERGGVAAHEGHELVVDDLHHQFLGLEGVDYVLAEGLLLDGVGEGLGHLIVDVGVVEGLAHVLEGDGDVDLGDFALAFEDLERAFETLGEVAEHWWS